MKPKRFVPTTTRIKYNPGDLVEVIGGWGEYSLMTSPKVGSLGLVVKVGFIKTHMSEEDVSNFLTILVDGEIWEVLKANVTKKD
jgi:hypothetical protein